MRPTIKQIGWIGKYCVNRSRLGARKSAKPQAANWISACGDRGALCVFCCRFFDDGVAWTYADSFPVIPHKLSGLPLRVQQEGFLKLSVGWGFFLYMGGVGRGMLVAHVG
jgi:hypothetical protein